MLDGLYLGCAAAYAKGSHLGSECPSRDEPCDQARNGGDTSLSDESPEPKTPVPGTRGIATRGA